MLSHIFGDEDLALDMLRYLALLEGGVVLGLSVFVFRLYMYARRLTKRVTGKEAVGAPPYHVAAIAISHCFLILGQIAVVLDSVGGGHLVWFGTPIALVAFTLSLAALLNMLQHESLRIQNVLKAQVKRPRQPG
jgi:hypothetical protein